MPGRCTCRVDDCSSPGKHPRVAGGLNAATVDGAQVEAWWSRWPIANVGVRTGAASGLVVIDIDPAHGGTESLERLVAQHGELPEGRVVRTGSDGRHLYFLHPGGLVHNDAGRRLGPGLDIRGDGGYVIAPPSTHTSGGRYALESGGADLPEMPEWMLMLVRPPELARPRVAQDWRPTGDTTAWAKAALEGERARLRTAQPGMRNHTLNRVAFRLGQIIAGGQLEESEVVGLLVRDALATGLGEREALATVQSGLTAGEVVPRAPSGPRPHTDGADVAH
jgi:hypothetical protein